MTAYEELTAHLDACKECPGLRALAQETESSELCEQAIILREKWRFNTRGGLLRQERMKAAQQGIRRDIRINAQIRGGRNPDAGRLERAIRLALEDEGWTVERIVATTSQLQERIGIERKRG